MKIQIFGIIPELSVSTPDNQNQVPLFGNKISQWTQNHPKNQAHQFASIEPEIQAYISFGFFLK
jgi:hypothetical protein